MVFAIVVLLTAMRTRLEPCRPEAGTFDGTPFNVKQYGAKGDGVADDTPAVQATINAAAANPGGGMVLFPKGTYLLNSVYPSSHPWFFYNLKIESTVTLSGATGAKLLQGPKRRHPLPSGATEVRNTALPFAQPYQYT